jgi:integrase
MKITFSIGPKGFWYWSCHTPIGRLRRSTKTRDEAEARAMLPRIEAFVAAAIKEKQPDTPNNPTLTAIHKHYLETAMPNRGCKQRSIDEAGGILRDWERFCADEHIGRVQQINLAVLERYQVHLRGRGKSPRTVVKYLTIIRATFGAAYESEMIAERPIRKWRMPKLVKSEVWAPTGAEMRDILAMVRDNDPEIWPAVYAIASTGLRPSDVVSLKPEHIDGTTLRRTMTKTGERVSVPVSRALLDAVASQRVRSPQWVFVSHRGKPWPLRTLLRRFKAASRAFGRDDLNLKSLRHGLARLMVYELGLKITEAQAQLGHTKSDMTLTYAPSRVSASVAEAVADKLG